MDANTYANRFTAKHLSAVRALGHIVLGPQTVPRTCSAPGQCEGELSMLVRCGLTAGPGEMTDWRDVINAIQDMAALFHMRQAQAAAERMGDPSWGAANSGYQPAYMRGARDASGVDVYTLLEETAKAGTPAQALKDINEDASSARIHDTAMNVDNDDKDKGKAKEKGKSKSQDKIPDKPPIPTPFAAFRVGWGESSPDTGLEWPIAGLPTTAPDRINLGPRADSLSTVPIQFSSQDHWKLMSETGYFRSRWWIG